MNRRVPIIRKDMLISDIVGLYPDTAEIMMNYGLHCIGCHYNAFETLEQGILGHGYNEEELNQLLAELNAFVLKTSGGSSADEKIVPEAETMKITITPKALVKISSVMKNEKKQGMMLRLEVTGVLVFKYALNFVEQRDARNSEKIFSFSRGKVRLLADKKDYPKINDLLIDYVKEGDREGFKMIFPREAFMSRSKMASRSG